MTDVANLEIYLDGAWCAVASVRVLGAAERGWEAGTDVGYSAGYALDNEGRTDAAALSVNLPVSLESTRGETWPPFLADMLPQGFGRQELLRQLGMPETSAASADWRLLLAGAGNPIGNIRVREAAVRLEEHALRDRRGFTEGEVVERGDAFTEHLVRHGLFVAGSSGVQGEWPKLLLAEGHDGLYYLDHALPDEDVAAHWLVKFSRGPSTALATILRLEAPYMELARHLGLDVYGRMRGGPRTLFIPRFDRAVTTAGVLRYAQESIASLCGLAGFGLAPSHNVALRRLAAVCSHRERDVVEYVRRDVANIALGNKDNHARNTAIQRRADGYVGLTPLFDFVPMMLHPDGIARRMRWESDDGGAPRWASVIRQAVDATGIEAAALTRALIEMVGPLRRLRQRALEIGVDEAIMDMQRASIDDIVSQIEAL
ncbi:type II toxin-antitoxin system HipA family toxin [Pinirhizobacter sp.]|uniref:type II toxin-antitoxin system HipA family toxin n=1 Tax=Pinirhizobacter sp. TaxID=2950432 RepID=UPI002F4073A8